MKKITMKNTYSKVMGLVMLAAVLLPSCEGDLAEINVNPNQSDVLAYGTQLLAIEQMAAGTREVHMPLQSYNGAIIQHVASLGTINVPGDKYMHVTTNVAIEPYMYRYSSGIKNVVDLVERTAEDPEESNFHNIARIMKAFMFSRITDQHGDVPYSEAGRAFLDGNNTPAFDAQEDIYRDIINELTEAVQALDDSKRTYGTDELLYQGDLDKWRKLGNSLLLRFGLRVSNVDPSFGQQVAVNAINRGVFESNEDNMVTKHFVGSHDNTNGLSQGLEVNRDVHRLSERLINKLTDTGDPRLDIFSLAFDGVSPHKGLPNGYDFTTILDHPEGSDDLSIYSWFNPALITLDAPMIHVTYSEVELMLAEASLKGWIGDDAAEHYNNGVAAGMTQWDIYSGVAVPDQAQIDAYLAANPFDGSLEMIGEQYWLTTFLNPYETWSKWRRTGYPALVPVNYPGNATGGTIPRRLAYPEPERTLNTENYNAAVSRQGADEMTTRIWWDQ